MVLKTSSQVPIFVPESSSADGDSENESTSEQSEDGSGGESKDLRLLPVSNRKSRSKSKKGLFIPAEPMKGESDLWDADISVSEWEIPAANFDLIHQQEWEANIVWEKVEANNLNAPSVGRRCLVEVDSDSDGSHMSGIEHEQALSEEYNSGLGYESQWHRPFSVEPLCRPCSSGEDNDESVSTLRHPQMLRLETIALQNEHESQGRTDLLKRISNLTLETKEKNLDLSGGDWLNRVYWEQSDSLLPRSQVTLTPCFAYW